MLQTEIHMLQKLRHTTHADTWNRVLSGRLFAPLDKDYKFVSHVPPDFQIFIIFIYLFRSLCEGSISIATPTLF